MSSISGVGGGFRPHHKPPSFDQIDSNSDGGISLDEFESAAPKGADSAKSEELFKKIDTDGDGSITKAESDAFKDKAKKADSLLQSFLFSLQAGGTQNAQAASDSDSDKDSKSAFDAIDSDVNGGISKDEFSAAFKDSRLNSDQLNRLFSSLDKNGDGSVSQDEVKAFQSSLQQSGERHHHRRPPEAFQNASQAYGSASQLSAQGTTETTYAKAA
ncbi:EF-hand domain-containing protein [Bosea sp. UNC402CLCol]|jgi:Ca2+-binding EF-hand superfamily protein|uniref:EF-hand domain-containing protein n=1 Tax=Bosea sp. UNC402CLCol TaxID=1510531 RepID=UPI00057133F0|nr:EF-hand domain-containing protein [Bosea sp. UNC402CLCol]